MPHRSHPVGPPGTPALSARRIVAPVTVSSPELAWQVQPGATFLAGSLLGTLQSAAARGNGVADFFCLLVFMVSLGLCRLGRLAGEQALTAPEDGVLTWCLPNDGPKRLRRGTLLATYLPLKAWQDYERLLKRQDAVIATGQAAALPALRAEEVRLTREVAALRQQLSQRRQDGQRVLQGKLGELTEQLTARAAELDPSALDANTTNTLLQLVRQVGGILRQNCPLPPREFFALYDNYLGPLLVLEDRFRRLDAEFLKRYRQTQTDPEKELLLVTWQQRKEDMVERLVGSGKDTGDLP